MPTSPPDHYATLGLDQGCTDAHIRSAYRLLAKQHHPDVNGGSRAAVTQTQALNAAHEILSDPERRRDYDRELTARSKTTTRSGRASLNITTDVHLRLEEFLRGTSLEVTMTDPVNRTGVERHELVVPPGTAPGARLRLARSGGGFVVVRVKARPDFRFRVRGSDLRCDLKISPARARQGGPETVRGLTGGVRVTIPPGVGRGEIIRLPGEGLPRPRGGRGDLLVRITYQPEVKITRSARR